MFKSIKKRDGRIVRFNPEKITDAIEKAGVATGEFGRKTAEQLTIRVLNLAQQALEAKVPNVEDIQDIVEEILLSSSYRKIAKSYILYWEQHNQIRQIVSKAKIGRAHV